MSAVQDDPFKVCVYTRICCIDDRAHQWHTSCGQEFWRPYHMIEDICPDCGESVRIEDDA